MTPQTPDEDMTPLTAARVVKLITLVGGLLGVEISPEHAEAIVEAGIIIYSVVTAIEAKFHS